MPNLFCKVHRLKSQGWTWDHFLSELERIYPSGIDEKTLKSHYRQPHKRATSHTQQLIETLHSQYFPSPFPVDIEALMRLYNNLVACPKHGTIESDIADLQCFLRGQLDEPQQTALRSARLHWLLANTYFDGLAALRSVGKRNQLETSQQRAVQHYQQAIQLIELHNQQVQAGGGEDNATTTMVSEFTLYKLRQNILACYLNAVAPEQREHDEKVLNYLTHSDFMTQSARVMEQEPYLWVVARNGLRFGSLLRSAVYCQQFFGLLVTASRWFEDLDYAPLGYPAIHQSKEFHWACQHVLNEEAAAGSTKR